MPTAYSRGALQRTDTAAVSDPCEIRSIRHPWGRRSWCSVKYVLQDGFEIRRHRRASNAMGPFNDAPPFLCVDFPAVHGLPKRSDKLWYRTPCEDGTARGVAHQVGGAAPIAADDACPTHQRFVDDGAPPLNAGAGKHEDVCGAHRVHRLVISKNSSELDPIVQ